LITRLRNSSNHIPTIFLFESLPGAGAQLAPRLLSLFVSDRSRRADAADIQKYSGIAPVIERSGKSVWVHRRLSRPIFICQTFHEFAQQSVQRSAWADQYYRRQREKGKSHHSAIRALAFKWIRIIFACWKANKPYGESFNLSTFTPLKNAILPFPQLDGPPQTLEGTHEVGRRPFMPDSTLNRPSAALLRGQT
jgi:Transposase IS116/IS110/IS902 family